MKIEQIDVTKLKPFANHPFKIRQDSELAQMTESIRDYGVITPILARPIESGYEVVSGHRRLAICKELGVTTVPAVVREMANEEAVIAMVDSNLQRENVLPSEKAFAYKMKLEAIKHPGKTTSRQVVGKLESADLISNDESGRQIQRYILLTELIPEILQMVDEGKIAFNPAVELSYLSPDEQEALLNIMQIEDCTPSHSQAIRLKKLSQEGQLDNNQISEIISELKPNQQEQYKFKREDIRKYFPKSYSDAQDYLEKKKRVTYLNLLTSGRLNEHLYQTEQTALQRLELLTKQLSQEQGVTKELKEKAPMQWVQMMNNIRSQAEEMILSELIYS